MSIIFLFRETIPVSSGRHRIVYYYCDDRVVRRRDVDESVQKGFRRKDGGRARAGNERVRLPRRRFFDVQRTGATDRRRTGGGSDHGIGDRPAQVVGGPGRGVRKPVADREAVQVGGGKGLADSQGAEDAHGEPVARGGAARIARGNPEAARDQCQARGLENRAH